MKTSQLMMLGAIAMLAMNAPELATMQSQQSLIKTTRNQTRQDSRIALERYRANCARVVESQTFQEGQLVEGWRYVDPATKQPLRDGAAICTKHGDTAISDQGKATDIKRVATQDLQALEQLLKANENARTRAGV